MLLRVEDHLVCLCCCGPHKAVQLRQPSEVDGSVVALYEGSANQLFGPLEPD